MFPILGNFTDDEQTACENVEEVSLSSLVVSYGDEVVVRALEAYVRILSDERTKVNFGRYNIVKVNIIRLAR